MNSASVDPLTVAANRTPIVIGFEGSRSPATLLTKEDHMSKAPLSSTNTETPVSVLRRYRESMRRAFASFAAVDDEGRYNFLLDLHRTDPELAKSLALDEHGDLKAFPW